MPAGDEIPVSEFVGTDESHLPFAVEYQAGSHRGDISRKYLTCALVGLLALMGRKITVRVGDPGGDEVGEKGVNPVLDRGEAAGDALH